MQNNLRNDVILEQSRINYERYGYCIFREQVVPDDILVAAPYRMTAVRNGVYDLSLPTTEHPDCDPNVLCKINNPHRSDKGLY